mgnify:FL=1
MRQVELRPAPRWIPGEVVFEVHSRAHGPVGEVAYMQLDRASGSAEVGIVIFERFRGMGYGEAALRALLDHLFQSVGLRRVWLRVLPANRPALRCYRKCGFRVVREVRWPLLGILRYLVMELRQEDFQSRKEEVAGEEGQEVSDMAESAGTVHP